VSIGVRNAVGRAQLPVTRYYHATA